MPAITATSKQLTKAILLIGIFGAESASSAATAVYVLKDVIFTASSVNGSPVQPPFTPPTDQMTGILIWTYNSGDFANGSGTFAELKIPWTYYGIGPATISSNSYGQYLSLAIDQTSLNGTLAGPSVHSQGIDFQVNLSPVLSNPDQGTTVSSSANSFDIWGSNGYEYTGSQITGSIVPYQPALSIEQLGTNAVIRWPTNYAEGFMLQTATSLDPGTAWTTSSIPAVIVSTNWESTNAIAADHNTFFRLLR